MILTFIKAWQYILKTVLKIQVGMQSLNLSMAILQAPNGKNLKQFFHWVSEIDGC